MRPGRRPSYSPARAAIERTRAVRIASERARLTRGRTGAASAKRTPGQMQESVKSMPIIRLPARSGPSARRSPG